MRQFFTRIREMCHDLHGCPDGAAFAETVNRAAAADYGSAGPAFVTAFLESRETCEVAARRAISAFRAEAHRLFCLSTEGQIDRAVRRLGLIAAAGELATSFGITGWKTGEARQSALSVLRLWIEGRGGSGPAEAREAIARVRAFIEAHGASRFERIGDYGELCERVAHRVGWRDGDRFYIGTSAWQELHGGADPRRAARHLQEAGFLEAGDGRNMAIRVPRGIAGRPRAYCIKANILGSADD